MSRRGNWGALLGLAAVAAGVLAGCAPWGEPEETPEPEPTASAPADDASAAEHDGKFNADGTASDNLDVFTAVMEKVWASDTRDQGATYVDALVEAGFDKSQMQVTEDYTTVQLAAESIMFSVKWGDECLIGQVGPETGDPIASVQDVVGDGMCLIGNTRDIDW